MTGTKRYPGIARAALKIALDNGGINRNRSVEQMQKELHRWLAVQPPETLAPIDAWLIALSDDDMELVCCGERQEAANILAGAPPFTDDMLDSYFNEVC